MANTDLTTRTVQRVSVQTARSIQPNDDGWTTQPRLRFVGGSDGQGQVYGDAHFEQVFGVLADEGETSYQSVGVTPNIDHGSSQISLGGQYVRLVLIDNAGGTKVDSSTGTPFWWGVMLNPGEASDGSSDTKLGGSATWDALDLKHVLEQIKIREGFELAADGKTVMDSGYMPKFNDYPTGDRSTDQVTVNGRPAYVFDRFTAADIDGPVAHKWNAANIIDLLLKGCGKPTLPKIGAGLGLGWALYNTNDPCLQFIPHGLDVSGMSLLDAINTIVNMRRGLTWYVTVGDGGSNDVAFVHVTSTVKTAITTPTFTLPAAAIQTAIDWRGDVFLEDMVIAYDYSNVYDVIELRGNYPWVGMTWWWQLSKVAVDVGSTGWSATEKGWTTAEGTNYDAGGIIDPVTGVMYSNDEKVWRYFRIRNKYNGQQYNDAKTGLRNVLETKGDAGNPDALYGCGGYDGTRSFDASKPTPPAFALEMTRELPCHKGFVSAPLGPRQDPLYLVGTGAIWQSMTEENQISIISKPPAVDFGTVQEEAQEDDNVLLFTIGVRESQPLKVSWQRKQSDWPRDTPRVFVLTLPEWEQWITLKNTIVAVRADATLQPLAADVTSRDDISAMQSMLGLLLPYFSVPAALPSWRDRGILDTSSAKRPSALVTTVTKGDGAVDCNAVITKRQWQFIPEQGEIGQASYMPAHYDTLYVTGRPVPDIESFR
jgi:hypothetical protein